MYSLSLGRPVHIMVLCFPSDKHCESNIYYRCFESFPSCVCGRSGNYAGISRCIKGTQFFVSWITALDILLNACIRPVETQECLILNGMWFFIKNYSRIDKWLRICFSDKQFTRLSRCIVKNDFNYCRCNSHLI